VRRVFGIVSATGALLAAIVAIGAALPFATSVVHACDTELVRAQARRDVPDYRLGAVRVQEGIVTLLFKARGCLRISAFEPTRAARGRRYENR